MYCMCTYIISISMPIWIFTFTLVSFKRYVLQASGYKELNPFREEEEEDEKYIKNKLATETHVNEKFK